MRFDIPVQEDKGKNSFFPGILAEKSQVLLEYEENEQDNWEAIALSCRSKNRPGVVVSAHSGLIFSNSPNLTYDVNDDVINSS